MTNTKMPKKRTARPPVGKKDVVKKETKSVQLIFTSFPKQSHPAQILL